MIFNNVKNKTTHFHIVGDLHLWDKNIRSHVNYIKECVITLKKIISHIKEAKEKYPNDLHYIILLGDIFNREFSNNERIYFNLYYQYFLIIRGIVNDIFCVVGNHEQNYPRNNPFWNLISQIEENVELHNSHSVFGLLPILRVVDNIEINNCLLQFQHFGEQAKLDINFNKYRSKFLFAHEIYMNSQLLSVIENELGENQKYKYIKWMEILEDDYRICNYDECFMGHIHSIIGDWRIRWNNGELTGLHYLGSQIPVSKDEYIHTPNYRYIKDLIIAPNGEFNIQTDKYLITPINEALKINQIKKDEVAYEKVKEKKQLFQKHKDIKFNGQDPIEILTKEYENDIEKLEVFNKLETGIIPDKLKSRMILY